MSLQNTFITEFKDAMAATGLICEDSIIADGQFHHFHVVNIDNPNKRSGWYKLYADSIPAGAFGCFKLDISESWCSKKENEMTSAQWTEYRERIEATKKIKAEERALEWASAKETAKIIWENAEDANDNHPYLIKKKVKAYTLRVNKNNALIIPLYDTLGILHSLQFISADGTKIFLKDGAIKGNYFLIGELTNTLYITEGFATAAALHEATNCGVIVAFYAGNLLSVAQAIKTKYANNKLIFAADNDQFTSNNPGLTKAKEASLSINASVIFPEFKNLDGQPTDWNDLFQREGIEVVKEQLTKVQTSKISSEEPDKKSTITTKVIALLEGIEFFHDKHRDAYATIITNGYPETLLIESNYFKDWLSKRYWDAHKSSLNRNSLSDILSVIKGRALFDGSCQKVFTRVASLDDNIFVNLANEEHQIIEVTSSGWQIISHSPIKFKITTSMRSLPRPQLGGDIELLFQLINVPEKSRKLVIAWILECFRIDTHFPILVLNGVQGSAKSTTQNILRSLIDPSASNLRSAPRKSEDLVVNAKNNWLVSFNNLSNLNPQEQDDLCCLSTGGGFSTRRLFTTSEEELFDIKRPVILNGINDLITQQDLIDRCIVVELQPISEKQRRTDTELLAQFENAAPQIFGALLTALSKAIAELPTIHLPEKPRLADFALLGVALEKILGWESGSFIKEYKQARTESMTMAMEHSPVAISVIQFIEMRGIYSGSYSDLYKDLTRNFKPEMAGWPKSAKGLASQLKRQAVALKMAGVEIIFDVNRKNDGYHIKIKKIENNVHYVHQVHESNAGAASRSELTSEHVHVDLQCSSQVHLANPGVARVRELSEHSELINHKKIYEQDREVLVL